MLRILMYSLLSFNPEDLPQSYKQSMVFSFKKTGLFSNEDKIGGEVSGVVSCRYGHSNARFIHCSHDFYPQGVEVWDEFLNSPAKGEIGPDGSFTAEFQQFFYAEPRPHSFPLRELRFGQRFMVKGHVIDHHIILQSAEGEFDLNNHSRIHFMAQPETLAIPDFI